MPLYMLDTNMVSYIVSGRSPAADQKLRYQPLGAVCISAVTAGEIRYELRRLSVGEKLRAVVESFFRLVPAIAWNEEAAEEYGLLRHELQVKGKAPGPLDIMIAAHARSLDLTLVTGDRGFAMVPDLRIENWATALSRKQ